MISWSPLELHPNQQLQTQRPSAALPTRLDGEIKSPFPNETLQWLPALWMRYLSFQEWPNGNMFQRCFLFSFLFLPAFCFGGQGKTDDGNWMKPGPKSESLAYPCSTFHLSAVKIESLPPGSMSYQHRNPFRRRWDPKMRPGEGFAMP